MQGLASRLARAVNRALGRTGKLWADRYHARALSTPRELRNALVYVLMNWKKHRIDAAHVDPCSGALVRRLARRGASAQRLTPAGPRAVAAPVALARTWLLRVGWRRHGLLTADDRPA
jgi:hypothetical protein